jgi:predicted transcriptional regulator
MPQVFRRLAMLPDEMVGPVGLVICDSAGEILLRKPALGFAVPRAGGACALWPLFTLLARSDMALRQRLEQGEARVLALAASEQVSPPGFDMPALTRPHMLILPDDGAAGIVRAVGSACRVCPIGDCAARREPSLLESGF